MDLNYSNVSSGIADAARLILEGNKDEPKEIVEEEQLDEAILPENDLSKKLNTYFKKQKLAFFSSVSRDDKSGEFIIHSKFYFVDKEVLFEGRFKSDGSLKDIAKNTIQTLLDYKVGKDTFERMLLDYRDSLYAIASASQAFINSTSEAVKPFARDDIFDSYPINITAEVADRAENVYSKSKIEAETVAKLIIKMSKLAK